MAKQSEEKKKTAVKPIKKESSNKTSNNKKGSKKTTKKNNEKASVKEVEKKEIIKKEEDKKEEKQEVVELANEEKEIEQSNLKSAIQLALIILAVIIVLIFFPNTPIWNIIIVFLILSVLIFCHELGHYIVGKKCGVHIYEFALGMGPKVLGFKRKNDPTEYTVRAFPIGGFCQLAGEEGEDDNELPKDKFMCNKSKLQRVLILIAGVTMNFIVAFILFFGLSFFLGSTELTSYIAEVEKDSPAAEAGMEAGDKIIELNGYKVSTWDKLTVIRQLKNESNTYEYVVEKENGDIETYKIKPAKYILVDNEYIKITKENTKADIIEKYELDEDKVEVTELVGIVSPSEPIQSFGNAIKFAFQKLFSTMDTMLLIITSLITGNLGMENISGPIGMYTVVDTVAIGSTVAIVANIINLMAYLSVNLGIINILPFPAFDGGRVLFIAIEALIGRKMNPTIEALIHNIGFFLILALMLYVTFQDILRLL